MDLLNDRILLIPSWEGRSADPEEKRGSPASGIKTRIDFSSLKSLDTNPPR